MRGLLTTQSQNCYREQIQKEMLTRLAWKSRYARLYPACSGHTHTTQLPPLSSEPGCVCALVLAPPCKLLANESNESTVTNDRLCVFCSSAPSCLLFPGHLGTIQLLPCTLPLLLLRCPVSSLQKGRRRALRPLWWGPSPPAPERLSIRTPPTKYDPLHFHFLPAWSVKTQTKTEM